MCVSVCARACVCVLESAALRGKWKESADETRHAPPNHHLLCEKASGMSELSQIYLRSPKEERKQ